MRVGYLQIECMLGSGVGNSSDVSTQSHNYIDDLQLWNFGNEQTGLELRGYHHVINNFCIKGRGCGIAFKKVTDVQVHNAYLVGPRTGLKWRDCNNITVGNSRFDTIATASGDTHGHAGFEIDYSRNLTINVSAFIIVPGQTLENMVKIGAGRYDATSNPLYYSDATKRNYNIFINMQATRLGGNLLEVHYCSESYIQLQGSHGGSTWGAPLVSSVRYGEGNQASLFVEQQFNSNISPLAADSSPVVGDLTTHTSGRVTTSATVQAASVSAQATAVGTAANGVLEVRTPDISKRALDYRKTGDAVSRWRVAGDGSMQFSDGATAGALPAGVTQSGGGALYVENGALKYRGGSGTVTTLGPA